MVGAGCPCAAHRTPGSATRSGAGSSPVSREAPGPHRGSGLVTRLSLFRSRPSRRTAHADRRRSRDSPAERSWIASPGGPALLRRDGGDPRVDRPAARRRRTSWLKQSSGTPSPDAVRNRPMSTATRSSRSGPTRRAVVGLGITAVPLMAGASCSAPRSPPSPRHEEGPRQIPLETPCCRCRPHGEEPDRHGRSAPGRPKPPRPAGSLEALSRTAGQRVVPGEVAIAPSRRPRS